MLSKLQKQLHCFQPYGLALAVYFSSRLVVVLAIEFAVKFVPMHGAKASADGANWYHHLLHWDSGWYVLIATQGYSYNGNPEQQQPIVFYPLYPLLSRLVAATFGIFAGDALLIIANLSSFAAILLLFKLVRERFGDDSALLTIALLSFFPTSLFFSAGYTEGLALLFIVGFFLLIERESWLLAAIFVALTLATRATGIVLLPVLLLAMWRKARGDFAWLAWYAPLCLAVASSGLWLYMIYLWAAFGHPFAFAQGQAAWHGHTSLGHRLFSLVTLRPIIFAHYMSIAPAAFDAWFGVMFLALLFLARRRLPTTMLLFALGVVLLPLPTLANGQLTSMSRYGLLAFPIFIALADFCRERSWLTFSIFGLFGGMLFMYSTLFAQSYWVD